MSKKLWIMFACTAMLSMAACGTKHQHITTDEWIVDAHSHWKVCEECSEKVDEEEHKENEEFRCEVCNTEVYDLGESKSLYSYDDYGNFVRMADYDEDGNLISEIVYDYEYDSEGNMLKSKTVVDGVLTEESEFSIVDGEYIISKTIGYMEDGSTFINEYDEYGNVIKMIGCHADGSIYVETESEYKLNDMDVWYESKNTTVYEDGSKIVSEYDENGEMLNMVSYDADGNEIS